MHQPVKYERIAECVYEFFVLAVNALPVGDPVIPVIVIIEGVTQFKVKILGQGFCVRDFSVDSLIFIVPEV